MAELPVHYASFVPEDRSTWATWTFADCDCEPESSHCPRCDGRRLMLVVKRRSIDPKAVGSSFTEQVPNGGSSSSEVPDGQ